ncbi:hypothetical protein CEUSTIGMA_g3409.t1 [Chlamydomonas eustigma]|uniref:Uncharacterized protein n=1 Tax=Chlamydomonas eustigma TaxID=1157962 RepID=A0A250WYV8_9CHLO|nr:hypothetical protein CEUSTIGMA_g3409.t1 [Chlamydomonas eustigma]|eukprot:GAX75966.1 hypothetical protein CEUSTIGMA_g3409.t1 [Chlamydomonas eustigma]
MLEKSALLEAVPECTPSTAFDSAGLPKRTALTAYMESSTPFDNPSRLAPENLLETSQQSDFALPGQWEMGSISATNNCEAPPSEPQSRRGSFDVQVRRAPSSARPQTSSAYRRHSLDYLFLKTKAAEGPYSTPPHSANTLDGLSPRLQGSVKMANLEEPVSQEAPRSGSFIPTPPTSAALNSSRRRKSCDMAMLAASSSLYQRTPQPCNTPRQSQSSAPKDAWTSTYQAPVRRNAPHAFTYHYCQAEEEQMPDSDDKDEAVSEGSGDMKRVSSRAVEEPSQESHVKVPPDPRMGRVTNVVIRRFPEYKIPDAELSPVGRPAVMSDGLASTSVSSKQVRVGSSIQLSRASGGVMSPEGAALKRQLEELDKNYGISRDAAGCHVPAALLPVNRLVDMRRTAFVTTGNTAVRPGSSAVVSSSSRRGSVDVSEPSFSRKSQQSAAEAFVSSLGMNLRKASMSNKVQTFQQAQTGVGSSGAEVLVTASCDRPRASRLENSAGTGFVKNLAGQFSRLFKV